MAPGHTNTSTGGSLFVAQDTGPKLNSCWWWKPCIALTLQVLCLFCATIVRVDNTARRPINWLISFVSAFYKFLSRKYGNASFYLILAVSFPVQADEAMLICSLAFCIVLQINVCMKICNAVCVNTTFIFGIDHWSCWRTCASVTNTLQLSFKQQIGMNNVSPL